MIAWLNPGALVALAAAALPVVVHLLLRHRAVIRRVATIRFLVRTRESAVRLQRPSDLLLLTLRVAALAAAAIALAAPVVITGAREAHWMARTVRAVVVDTSASVDATAAAEAAAAQMSSAVSARRFDDANVSAGISRAAAWLRTAPPGRPELVVVSDFQAGAATSASFAPVPAAVAVTTVAVPGQAAPPADVDGGTVFYGPRRYSQRITFEGAGTSYALRDTGSIGQVEFLKGASTSPEISGLASTLAGAGIFAPPVDKPVVVSLGSPDRRAHPLEPGTIAVDAPSGSLQAGVTVHDVLATRRDLSSLMEFEPQRIPVKILESWSRGPGSSDTRAWQRSESSDARWFWLASIGLLVAEAVVRRERAVTPAERANAA
jgi:hypothetical protein